MLINPDFLSALADEGLGNVETWLAWSIAVTVLIVTVIDVGEGFWEARKSGN
jgi:hypothetical protein